jgi:hydroxymethylglutaryl-CoA lyase
VRLPESVRIVEVGPRDGLQNESTHVPTAAKIAFIDALAAAGLPEIEATSFVHPKWVPQLADAAEVAAGLAPGPAYTALVPNLKGFERAVECGFRRVAVFMAATETFSQKNTNRSIAQSLTDLRAIVEKAGPLGIAVRGYLSVVWYCPYEGKVMPSTVAPVVAALREMGIEELSLGDTVGLAVPTEVEATLQQLDVPRAWLALHFHDTAGTALANVMTGLHQGVRVFDSSAGGLGGCPYSPGATGNLATEDLVYALEQMGVHTGVDLERVAAASRLIAPHLDHPLPSRQLRRLDAKRSLSSTG